MAYRGAQGREFKRLEQIRALYGFDKPAHERFIQMLGQFARFDLGAAFSEQRRGSWSEKAARVHQPGAVDLFISYLVAVPLGVAKAVRAVSRFDLVTTLIILVGYAIPGFVLGVALLVVFGGQLQWFSAARADVKQLGHHLSLMGKTDYLWHITLPITAMVAGSFAMTAMLTRTRFWRDPQAIRAHGARQGPHRTPGALGPCSATR